MLFISIYAVFSIIHNYVVKAGGQKIDILLYSILFYSILFYSILFYSILFYSILLYSILFYSILFYSILVPLTSACSTCQREKV